MTEIRKCYDHGFYRGNKCPSCDEQGVSTIDNEEKTRSLSKFLSGLLRHFPEKYNIDINNRGWAKITDVSDSAQQKSEWVETEHVLGVISTDKKGRYEVEDNMVRATYGHSIDVNIRDSETNTEIPDELYHGTTPDRFETIMEDGIKSMNRQNVHLTDSIETAINTGKRHCKTPVILKIDAKKMNNNKIDIEKRGEEVYLCNYVRPRYIEEL